MGGNPDDSTMCLGGWYPHAKMDRCHLGSEQRDCRNRLRYNAITGEITDPTSQSIMMKPTPTQKQGFDFEVVPGPVVRMQEVCLILRETTEDMEATITHEAGMPSGWPTFTIRVPQYVPDMLDGNQNVTMYGFIKDEENAKRPESC